MAQATASVIVEQGAVAQDIDALATALAGEAGIASASVDPGAQGIVQVDIVATADAGTKQVTNVDTGTHTSGTALLAVNGHGVVISDGESAASIEAKLEALPNVVAATVTGSGTGASPWVITIDDPIGPADITLTSIDLAGGSGESADEVTPGVAGSAAAGATAIADAITAVGDVELYGAVVSIENPVATISDDTPSLAEDEKAAVDITFALSGSTEAVVQAVGIEPFMRFTDFGDPVRGSHYRSGQARLLIDPAGADVDGTYVVGVTCIDDNGNVGSAAITVTVTDPA